MAKRVKVFSATNKNGNTPLEKVKEKFTIDKATAQFIHTSHYMKEGTTPVIIGDFQNFELKGNDVFADLTLNDTGEAFRKQGIFKGISAELPIDGVCQTIAVLPLGVNPACVGAEYEKQYNVIEYQEGVKMTAEEVIVALATFTLEDKIKVAKGLSDNITADDKMALRKTLNVTNEWEEMSPEEKDKIKSKIEFEAKPQKTAKEIELEAKVAEYEAKEVESRVDSVIEANKTRLIGSLPRIAKAALMSAVKDNTVIEFEAGKDKITAFEQYKKDIEGLKDFAYLTQEYQSNTEKPNKEKSIDDYKKDVEKMHGGGKK